MYCRTCATQVPAGTTVCTGCGVRPLAGRQYCPNCGQGTPNPNQEICLACGVRIRSTPATTMQTSDVLYRVSGALMLMSGLWNMFMSFIWFISLIWVCVGVFWIIPGALALVYTGAGIAAIATGNKAKPIAFVPAIGLVVSMLNLNFVGMMLDVFALVLGIVGYSQAASEETQVATIDA